MNLKEYLIKYNISVPEFCVKFKFGIATIYRLIKGCSNVTKNVFKIQQVTNNEVTVQDLLKQKNANKKKRKWK